MTVQRTQKDDVITRMSSICTFALYLVTYTVLSTTIAFALSTAIQSRFMAFVLSFGMIGIGSYILVHFLQPIEMMRLDGRLLHELAKRRLVEFDVLDE